MVRRYAVKGAELCSGGLCYGLLEILWRGYTHVSMLVLGGLCFLMIIRVSKLGYGLLTKALLGGLGITLAEFAGGCVVNLWLGLNVWDYSGEAVHLLGQICLKYSLLWVSLCAVIIPVCELCYRSLPRIHAFLKRSRLPG